MSNHLSYKIDLTELIFTGKNKEYGAYTLRKSYKKYLTISLWIAIFFFLLVTVGPLVYNKLKPNEDEYAVHRKMIKVSELAEPPSIGEKKEIQKVEAPPPLKSTIAFLPPVVKPDEQVTKDYMPTVQELKNVDPGAKTQQGDEHGIDYSLLDVESVEEKVVKEEKKEEPFTYVEEMPSYPSGQDALLAFISLHIQYPEIAKRAGVEGKVLVQFVVEKSGEIDDIQVIKGIGAGCDEEAVRVCKMLPRWKPGRQNGKPVRVRMVIPFHFKLQG